MPLEAIRNRNIELDNLSFINNSFLPYSNVRNRKMFVLHIRVHIILYYKSQINPIEINILDFLITIHHSCDNVIYRSLLHNAHLVNYTASIFRTYKSRFLFLPFTFLTLLFMFAELVFHRIFLSFPLSFPSSFSPFNKLLPHYSGFIGSSIDAALFISYLPRIKRRHAVSRIHWNILALLYNDTRNIFQN